jgi:hypothetical protein
VWLAEKETFTPVTDPVNPEAVNVTSLGEPHAGGTIPVPSGMLPRVAPFAANVADANVFAGPLRASAVLNFAPNSNAKAASITTTAENKRVLTAALDLVRNI